MFQISNLYMMRIELEIVNKEIWTKYYPQKNPLYKGVYYFMVTVKHLHLEGVVSRLCQHENIGDKFYLDESS